jgi:hypothetical protein
MTTHLIDPAAEAAVGTDEAFVDLVCADDDLVRAEFEAIIAASWPALPVDPDPVPSPTPRDPERRCPEGTRELSLVGHDPSGEDLWSCQRSPPDARSPIRRETRGR